VNRVFLVGDHAAFRQVLATIFESETVLEAGPQAGSLTEVRRHVGRLDRVDVAIVNLSLPDGDGTGLVRELSVSGSGVPVLTLTESRDR